jgi:hypothetical protein
VPFPVRVPAANYPDIAVAEDFVDGAVAIEAAKAKFANLGRVGSQSLG